MEETKRGEEMDGWKYEEQQERVGDKKRDKVKEERREDGRERGRERETERSVIVSIRKQQLLSFIMSFIHFHLLPLSLSHPFLPPLIRRPNLCLMVCGVEERGADRKGGERRDRVLYSSFLFCGKCQLQVGLRRKMEPKCETAFHSRPIRRQMSERQGGDVAGGDGSMSVRLV